MPSTPQFSYHADTDEALEMVTETLDMSSYPGHGDVVTTKIRNADEAWAPAIVTLFTDINIDKMPLVVALRERIVHLERALGIVEASYAATEDAAALSNAWIAGYREWSESKDKPEVVKEPVVLLDGVAEGYYGGEQENLEHYGEVVEALNR